MTMTVHFHFAKSTKNTYRFEENGDPSQHRIGVLYVKKSAMQGMTVELGKGITVTIEAK